MHSKRRCEICTCSVILGELALSRFEITRAFQYYFPENLDASENFSDSSLNHTFESEQFRFPLFYEK